MTIKNIDINFSPDNKKYYLDIDGVCYGKYYTLEKLLKELPEKVILIEKKRKIKEGKKK